MRLDLAAGNQHQQRHHRNGGRYRRQRRIAERIIDLIPHCRFLPTPLCSASTSVNGRTRMGVVAGSRSMHEIGADLTLSESAHNLATWEGPPPLAVHPC